MKRSLAVGGTAIASVYSDVSIPARIEWYQSIGLGKMSASDDCIVSDKGFQSEHFTPQRAKEVFGDVEIHSCGDIGLIVCARN